MIISALVIIFQDVVEVILDLENNKALGVDYISNEMLKFGLCDEIINMLQLTFNVMIQFGVVPKNFNLSLVTPMPKKDKMNKVSDYRKFQCL